MQKEQSFSKLCKDIFTLSFYHEHYHTYDVEYLYPMLNGLQNSTRNNQKSPVSAPVYITVHIHLNDSVLNHMLNKTPYNISDNRWNGNIAHSLNYSNAIKYGPPLAFVVIIYGLCKIIRKCISHPNSYKSNAFDQKLSNSSTEDKYSPREVVNVIETQQEPALNLDLALKEFKRIKRSDKNPDKNPVDSALKNLGYNISAEQFFDIIGTIEQDDIFLKFALDDPPLLYSEICKKQLEDAAKIYVKRFLNQGENFLPYHTIIYKETVKKGLVEVIIHIIAQNENNAKLHWTYILPLAIKYAKLPIVQLYAKSEVPPIDAIYDKHGNLSPNNAFTILNLSLGYVFVSVKEFIDQNMIAQTDKTKIDSNHNLKISEILLCIQVLLDSNKTYIDFRENVVKKTYDILKSIRNFSSNYISPIDNSNKELILKVKNSVQSKFSIDGQIIISETTDKIIRLQDIKGSTPSSSVIDSQSLVSFGTDDDDHNNLDNIQYNTDHNLESIGENSAEDVYA